MNQIFISFSLILNLSFVLWIPTFILIDPIANFTALIFKYDTDTTNVNNCSFCYCCRCCQPVQGHQYSWNVNSVSCYIGVRYWNPTIRLSSLALQQTTRKTQTIAPISTCLSNLDDIVDVDMNRYAFVLESCVQVARIPCNIFIFWSNWIRTFIVETIILQHIFTFCIHLLYTFRSTITSENFQPVKCLLVMSVFD